MHSLAGFATHISCGSVFPEQKLALCMMSSQNVAIPNIAESAGPLLLGYVFNWGLYGALAVQVYMYYMSFPKDRNSIKALVFGVFVLETTQTILCTHDLFATYASGWGNPSQLQSAHLEWLATPILSGIVSCTVQLFFSYRLYILSHAKILGCIITALALGQCVAAITGGIKVASINDFARLQAEAKASTIVWLSGSALCDVIIAVCMCYHLSKKSASFNATQVILNRIIRLTIESGSLTATVATIDLILFVVFPQSNFHTTPALTIAKLYSNSLVLTFNSRMRIVGGRDNTVNTDLLELRTTKRSAPTVVSGEGTITATFPADPIRITTTSERTDDLGHALDSWSGKHHKSPLDV